MKKSIYVIVLLGLFTIGGSVAFAECPDCNVNIDLEGNLDVYACLPTDCAQYTFHFREAAAYPWYDLELIEQLTCGGECTVWYGTILDFNYEHFEWMILCDYCFPPYCQGEYGE